MIDGMKRITGSGALAASLAFYLPMSLTLAQAGEFGIIGRLVNEVTKPIFEFVLNTVNSLNKKVLKDVEVQDLTNILDVTRFIFLAAVTKMACSAIGIPVAFGTALVLQTGQFAISFLIEFGYDSVKEDIPEGQKEIVANLKKSLVPAFSLGWVSGPGFNKIFA